MIQYICQYENTRIQRRCRVENEYGERYHVRFSLRQRLWRSQLTHGSDDMSQSNYADWEEGTLARADSPIIRKLCFVRVRRESLHSCCVRERLLLVGSGHRCCKCISSLRDELRRGQRQAWSLELFVVCYLSSEENVRLQDKNGTTVDVRYETRSVALYQRTLPRLKYSDHLPRPRLVLSIPASQASEPLLYHFDC